MKKSRTDHFMKIKFLGTGTIAPNVTRAPSSYLLQIVQKTILIDIGPGVLQRLIRDKINPLYLDYVFVTHFHMDHISDLMAYLFMNKYPTTEKISPTTIVCHQNMQELIPAMEKILGFSMSELKSVQWNFIENYQKIPVDSTLNAEAVPMNHKPESLGYLFQLKNKTLFISGDTDISPELTKKLIQSDVSIIECSNNESNDIQGHLNPLKIAQLLSYISLNNMPMGEIFLSHFYPGTENSLILKKMLLDYPNLHIANDGDIINLEEI